MSALVYLLGTYSIVSAALYFYPQNRTRNRKKINSKKKFFVISHRGGAGESGENTIAAFDYSKSLGVDIIELDCHLTKDGQVVVCHDSDLYRVCGVKKNIRDLNYEELPDLAFNSIDSRSSAMLRKNVSTSLITNEEIHENNKFNNEDLKKIPLLETVFKRYPDTLINLDIKVNNNELINKVFKLITKYKRQDITIWGSFNEDVKRKCYALNPEIPVYFSKTGCLKLLFSIITGFLPFFSFNESYFEIIMPHNILKEHAHSLPFVMKAALNVAKIVFIRKSLFSHLQKRGVSVFLWVLNTEEEFDLAIKLGVDGIMTDYPSKLVNYLKANHPHLLEIE